MKTRYKFLYRSGTRYYWQSVLPVTPGESRHETVWCEADWFWGKRK